MEQALTQILKEQCQKSIQEASDQEIYAALLCIVKDKMKGMKRNEGSKKLYYISAEFLIGKLLSNNLINLGVFEETRQVLKKYGHDLTAVEEVELEPSLGNGGLGRLLFGFHRHTGTTRRRCWTELPRRTIPSDFCGPQAEGRAQPLDYQAELADQDGLSL